MATDPGVALSMGAFLFLVCLPAAMVFWVVVFRAAGLVADASTMPEEYRGVYRLVFPKGDESPAVHPVGPIAILVIVNLTAPFALLGRYGPLVVLEGAAYLLVQALWVRRFWLASRVAP
jgi:hypothetical protein